MKNMVIQRLFDSFLDLEQAIVSAKATLGQKENPPQAVLDRISYYEEILTKQKCLAAEMCMYAQKENWGEVARHIKLINALSAMIRDDAREIVSGLTPTISFAERELVMS